MRPRVLEKEKATLKPSTHQERPSASWKPAADLDNAAVRCSAVAHLLEERIAGVFLEQNTAPVFGVAYLTSSGGAASKTEGDVDAVVPRAQLVALASLASGSGGFSAVAPGMRASCFAPRGPRSEDFDAPEHLVAWAEAGDLFGGRTSRAHAT